MVSFKMVITRKLWLTYNMSHLFSQKPTFKFSISKFLQNQDSETKNIPFETINTSLNVYCINYKLFLVFDLYTVIVSIYTSNNSIACKIFYIMLNSTINCYIRIFKTTCSLLTNREQQKKTKTDTLLIFSKL